MAIYRFKDFIPKAPSSCYLAPGSRIIGNILLGEQVSVWHNCVLRGDVNRISIGSHSNIQDLSMLHVTNENPLVIDENVTIGHSVTLHGCLIGKNVLIGMGATILDKAIINEFSVVAAGSVVPPGREYPSYSMIMGSPAKVTRRLKEEEVEMLKKHYKSYLKYAQEFKDSSSLIGE
jgi:carbonic anhydrase/acetyltransferase-like protein (isoleucine patch superfamily)